MSVVSVFCKKGGVGKSTFVGFLAHYYATQGKKVLLISADDQNSIFKIFGADNKILEQDDNYLEFLLTGHAELGDIVADTIPSIALAFEKDSKKTMKEKPYGLERRVFTPFMISGIIFSSLLEAGLSVGVFFVSQSLFGYEVATTLTLLSVVVNELVFVYNCKDLKDYSHKKGLFGNKVMNWSTLIILLIQIPVFFTGIGSIFGLVKISVLQFLAVIGVNIVFFFVIELLKPLWRKCFKDK